MSEMPIDPGIRHYVDVLQQQGIETFESCQGGPGHACPEPTVRFHGNAFEGHRAFAIAMTHGLPVLSVRMTYDVNDGRLDGPYWEMTFRTRNERVVELDRDGMAPSDIARLVGVSPQRVHQILTGYRSPTDISRRKRSVDMATIRAEVAKAVEAHPYTTLAELGRMTGVQDRTVASVIARLGLPRIDGHTLRRRKVVQS